MMVSAGMAGFGRKRGAIPLLRHGRVSCPVAGERLVQRRVKDDPSRNETWTTGNPANCSAIGPHPAVKIRRRVESD
jgi:hypothetical protein